MRLTLKSLLVGLVVLAVAPTVASASTIFTFHEVAGNVELTVSGSINLDATLGFIDTFGTTLQAISPDIGAILPGDPVGSDAYLVTNAWQSFGGGGLQLFSSTSGDRIALFQDALGVPVGYVSGTPLSATGTFVAATFASLGMVPGSYVTPFSSLEGGITDSVIVNVVQTAPPVPEPTTLTLFGTGALGVLVRMRRRKQQ